MPISLTLVIVSGVLIACGVYLVLERTLTRIIMGFVLLSNGINLLFLMAIGVPGRPPFQGAAPVEEMSDPLPMAMVLTAIVISMALSAFGMALAHRAWQLFGHDEVPDDVEDRRVRARTRRRRSSKATGTPTGPQRALVDLVGAEADFPDDDHDEISDDLTSDDHVEGPETEADEETVRTVIIPPKGQRGSRPTGGEC
ncbi:Na(+)/H(+) antiporter subunit C [Helcobacillus massiliensis]|uniref:Multicomponent Na+:H+ antiporter subunit C n=1 Tax=Helcobacillus massiliensis TaxID=521392 RepID=A0A839QUF0_9MICO|nr:Na(+)/H(+) antiporter subunit C [Helcobacillus massiliensis]MCG7427258.1 Na(+)/H(+) antiporter subunit C [Helcobacillus sp. ACRRO]MBB3023268.1 multicomponent Na+:H+ antiporter subunit C [Helcobacillus massiliensis]MCT1556557.1 Na(+)/H(+) antiporter subunit C [Helcobacillus massiliensis]MCT2035751.1 Na(+)/H(+) antiporter subunit C [Helcobacillus massiliensis]MCT2331167.1 Na(+)/H(+) antiporter subunit C [Helcobacillus massiliensis]